MSAGVPLLKKEQEFIFTMLKIDFYDRQKFFLFKQTTNRQQFTKFFFIIRHTVLEKINDTSYSFF